MKERERYKEESHTVSLQFGRLCYIGILNLILCNGNAHLMVGQSKINENTTLHLFSLALPHVF